MGSTTSGEPERSIGRDVVIIGAGGFGREVLDIIDSLAGHGGLRCVGFVDDGDVRRDLLERRGVPLLGTTRQLHGLDVFYVVGIGSGSARERIVSFLDGSGCTPTTLIHPAATIGSDVRMASGVIVAAGARLTTNIDVGRHVDLHVNCAVGHDSVIEDFVSVFPGATVSGNVHIGRGATIGTGANVLPGVRIGAGAFVGAGAVVTKDVPARSTVVGSPAHPLDV